MSVLRFRGTITGLGSSSGVRIVVGEWTESPYAAFADVMLAEPDGTRHLLAASPEVAEFVGGTYRFDQVHVVPLELRHEGPVVRITAGDLVLRYRIGRRTPLGRALRLVPHRLATAAWWSRVTDPVARVAQRGVRTRGSARAGRVETYGAVDQHQITDLSGTWRGHDLGALRDVTPDPGFGFGSTSARPSRTTLVTTVRDRE